ncbi:MAG: hypothetical protein LBI87_03610 [Candidatus Accumulibacter sp.]|jgi:hypothetical protein|nr:hypothetical protein [Accumulibacter sp.]
MIAGRGISAALDAARNGGKAFARAEGGSSRYETGSHVDVEGLSLLAGFAGNLKSGVENLTLGAFFSATWAGHPYLDTSFQAGRVKTDFKSGDLVDSFEHGAKHDNRSGYHGVCLAGGYARELDETTAFAPYGPWFGAYNGLCIVWHGANETLRLGVSAGCGRFSERVRFWQARRTEGQRQSDVRRDEGQVDFGFCIGETWKKEVILSPTAPPRRRGRRRHQWRNRKPIRQRARHQSISGMARCHHRERCFDSMEDCVMIGLYVFFIIGLWIVLASFEFAALWAGGYKLDSRLRGNDGFSLFARVR